MGFNLGGAAGGAQAGGQAAGPWGAVIGGVAGGFLGGDDDDGPSPPSLAELEWYARVNYASAYKQLVLPMNLGSDERIHARQVARVMIPPGSWTAAGKQLSPKMSPQAAAKKWPHGVSRDFAAQHGVQPAGQNGAIGAPGDNQSTGTTGGGGITTVPTPQATPASGSVLSFLTGGDFETLATFGMLAILVFSLGNRR